MEHEGPPIDWDAFDKAGKGGRFLELLVKLPRTRWAEHDKDGYNLLHLACFGPNVAAAAALVQSGLVDVNVRAQWGDTPTHFAAQFTPPRVMEVLCVAGADLRVPNQGGYAPIDRALIHAHKYGGETVRVLVANGVRLSTVHENCRHRITPELEAFERGVLSCRAAVVAMLRVKQAGKLWMWDKFLLREISVFIWSTRYDKGWQTATQQQQEPVHPQ